MNYYKCSTFKTKEIELCHYLRSLSSGLYFFWYKKLGTSKRDALCYQGKWLCGFISFHPKIHVLKSTLRIPKCD